jgi:6-phosphofructokinase 1
LASKCIDFLIEEAQNDPPGAAFIGLQGGRVALSNLEDMPRMMDYANSRPKRQWWLDLRVIAKVMAQPAPHADLDDH